MTEEQTPIFGLSFGSKGLAQACPFLSILAPLWTNMLNSIPTYVHDVLG